MQEQYCKYLQQLLTSNQIKFQGFQEFKQASIKKQQQKQRKGPLKSNLDPILKGQLLNRYSRQMLLKEIQYTGQLKLIKSRVAVIGAGGIGCPLSLYLASAGIGTIGLFDSDKVDLTNLHRQIGHQTYTIGLPKTQSLKRTLFNINPTININEHPAVAVNTLNNLDGYDFVIDGSDNPSCRYLVNDYCMKNGKKLLSGACIGWQGQITCYGGKETPCYRCVWGDQQISLGGCSTLGVLGMVPGIVGEILGVECIKLIIDGKSSLEGQLLTFNAKTMTFRKLKLRHRKPECKGCGQNKLSIQTYDYSKYSKCAPLTIPEVPTITWQQYIQKLNNKEIEQIIIDVRGQQQYAIINLQNSTNIPYDRLKQLSQEQIKGLAKEKVIGVSCKKGIMSKLATDYLIGKGIKAVNLKGGIDEYGKQFDSDIVSL